MGTYLDHPYYTHQPFFIEVLKHTNGNILECGCGDGSTIMIKEQIKNTPRKLVSLESNLEWLNKYTHLTNNNHKFYHVPANSIDCHYTGEVWVKFIHENLGNEDFEIVFIDSSPWLSRKHIFDYFKDKAKIIIFHDFDYFPFHNIIGKTINIEINDGKKRMECDLTGVINNYKLFHPPFKYYAGATGPPTLVCSNLLNKPDFDNLINTIEQNLHLYYP